MSKNKYNLLSFAVFAVTKYKILAETVWLNTDLETIKYYLVLVYLLALTLYLVLCCRCHDAFTFRYILRSPNQTLSYQTTKEPSKRPSLLGLSRCPSERRCTGSRPLVAGPAGSLNARRCSPSTWSACRWLISATFHISATAPTWTALETFPS